MDVIISSLINFEIKVLSLRNNLESCASECSNLNGHLPYLFEARVENMLLRGRTSLELPWCLYALDMGYIFACWWHNKNFVAIFRHQRLKLITKTFDPYLKLIPFLTNCSSTIPSIDRNSQYFGRDKDVESKKMKETSYFFSILNMILERKFGSLACSKLKTEIGQNRTQKNTSSQS